MSTNGIAYHYLATYSHLVQAVVWLLVAKMLHNGDMILSWKASSGELGSSMNREVLLIRVIYKVNM